MLSRNGDTYTTNWTFNSNFSSSSYSFGNPISQTASSSLGGGTRTTTTTYQHNTSKWILGLPLVQTTNGKPLVQLDYDANGNITRYRRVGETKATLTYYGSGPYDGLLQSFKDGLNRETRINSYHRGVPTELRRPDGVTVRRTVDDNGWVTSQTDGNNVTTGFAHNAMGWLTRIDRVSPWSDTNITYSGLGAGVVQTSTRGNARTVTTYDRYHRPVTVQAQDLSGQSTTVFNTFQYDGLGRTIFESLPSASASGAPGIATTYDGLGRVLTQTNTADGSLTRTQYLSSNTVRVTDPVGAVTTTASSGYGSPDDGNPLTIAQPEGVTTQMTYDIWGNLTSATQGGFTQTWGYDNQLRLCRHTTPETGSAVYVHNAADEVIQRAEGQSGTSGCPTPASADRISMTYDAMGRPTLINFPSGTHDVTMTYDNNGNMRTLNRGGANWAYTYNSANLPTSERLTIDGRTYNISYTYNADEALSTENTASGTLVAFWPDGFGRATRVRTNNNYNVCSGAGYHVSGGLNSLSCANGQSYSAGFNARQLLTSERWAKSGTVAMDFDYAHDANGRIRSINDDATNQDKAFTYDGLGRLTSANGPWGSGAFDYDTVNNIIDRDIGATDIAYQYDSQNRLESVSGTLAPSSTELGRSTYRYDGHNRRVKQVSGGETVYSVYNLAGQLVLRDNITTGKRTDYLRMGGMTVARRDQPGTLTWVHNDHLGSPVAASNSAGAVLWREQYMPFGEKHASSAANDNDMSFTGHIADTATGLTYMQARYYDSRVGRFLSNDPVGFAEGGVGYFNRYAYVANDPVNATDPTGMWISAILRTVARPIAKQGVRQSLRSRLASSTAIDRAELAVDLAFSGGDPAQLASIAADQFGGKLIDAATDAASGARRIADNARQGRQGEALTRAKLGDDVAGEQVSFRTSDGSVSRPDFVTKDGGIVETKTGSASLSTNQQKLFDDVSSGTPVTPIGQNAADAGLTPGRPTVMKSCEVDRPC